MIIMFVDDEKYILNTLRRLFKKNVHEYVFKSSGKEALEYFADNRVGLIVSDIRMPEMDGFELLSIIKKKYPRTIRVALSGYSDSQTIYKLLNDNIAKLYLFKPWENDELVQTLNNMILLEESLIQNELLKIVSEIGDLPTLPDIYVKISKMIQNDTSVNEITKIVEKDQSIASKILRIANSAFYGSKTGTVSQAIMMIGLSNLKNIILTTIIFDKNSYGFKNIERLWEHTILTNNLVNLIYEKCLNKKITQENASVGLLHDIGKVVLYTNFSETYSNLMSLSKEKNIPLVELEYEQFGTTHQELGAFILNWWELPNVCVEVSMYHHRPFDQRVISKEIVKVVYLANHFAYKKLPFELVPDAEYEYVIKSLGLEREAFEKEINEYLF